MRWEMLKNAGPHYGTECVVAHYVGQNKKPITGLWVYCNTYWNTQCGERIQCNPYDRWCEVSDIIESVENRIVNELRDFINVM